MNKFVTDTHSLFWYLLNLPLLGANANAAFDEAKNGNSLIYIPAIVFAEMFYLNVKLKNQIDFAVEFQNIKQSGQFVLVAFEPDDVIDFDKDSAVTEMHD